MSARSVKIFRDKPHKDIEGIANGSNKAYIYWKSKNILINSNFKCSGMKLKDNDTFIISNYL